MYVEQDSHSYSSTDPEQFKINRDARFAKNDSTGNRVIATPNAYVRMYICDQICKKGSYTCIQFSNFGEA